MVSLYFGLPGAGKTTLLCYHALKAVESKLYKNVYTNVHIAVPGVTYIDNDCIGRYQIEDGLVLIDEATLFADSRSYKEFGKDKLSYFLQHRHYNVDIFLYTQQWDGVDRKIRVITDRCYYVFKNPLLGRWWTCYYRIPYGIIIPDPKNSDGQKLGDIVQGYCKPSLFERLFCKKLWRPRYYQYFDSWERPSLPKLPDKYKAYQEVYDDREMFFRSRLNVSAADWQQFTIFVRERFNCEWTDCSRRRLLGYWGAWQDDLSVAAKQQSDERL